MLKVVGGELRGRRLVRPGGESVRPTSNRVREALFDVLGPKVVDATFVDGFAGSGAVGIEALSRGARAALFLESARPALTALRRNLAGLGLRDRSRILAGSWEAGLRTLERDGLQAAVVFLDPPYRLDPHPLARDVRAAAILEPGGRLVLEVSGRRKLDFGTAGVTIKRYGDTALVFIDV